MWMALGLSAFFLYSHLCILYGTVKQREKQVCINPAEMKKLDETLAAAKGICVDGAKTQIADTQRTKDELSASKANAVYWQKKYNEASAVSTTRMCE